jgi:predicted  nucleic acid-binding Zn-ribbon protein
MQKAEIKITADVRGAIASVRQLATQYKSSALDINESFQQASKASTMMGVGLTAVGAAGTLFLTKSTTLAARVETLGVVMRQVGKVAGYSAKEMEEFEAAVIKQGITTQVARTSLVQMAQSQVDLANATKLARIAQDAAVIAGTNSSEAFKKMNWALSTLNPILLKHMGLAVNLEAEYKIYAEAQGIAAENLTVLQKKQAMVNAIMKAGTKITGAYAEAMTTAGKKMTSIARYWEEARLSIGETFTTTFAGMIDAATDLLKGFNALSREQKDFVAITLAAGTAVATLLGPILILLPQLGAITGMIVGVGDVLLTTSAASAIASTGMWNAAAASGALGAGLTGIAAVTGVGLVLMAVVAGTALLVTHMKRAADAANELRKASEEEELVMRHVSSGFESYTYNAESYARATGKAVTAGETFTYVSQEAALAVGIYNAELLVGQSTTSLYGRRLEALGRITHGLTEEQFQHAKVIITDTDAVSKAAKGYQALADTYKRGNSALMSASEQTEYFREQLDDLSYVMDLQLSKSMEEAKEKVDEFKDKINEIKDEIYTLVDRIDELESKEWLSRKEQRELEEAKEALEDLQDELDDTRNSLDDERDAWKRNTAEILMNMAQRALANAPLAVQGEVIGQMALKLGLIDEVGATAFANVTAAIGEALATGKWEEVYELIGGMHNWLWGFPDVVKTKIVIDVESNYGLPPGGGGGKPPAASGWSASDVEEESYGLQHGGRLGKGVYEVGEVGWEYVIDGVVIPHEVSKRLKRLGLISEGGFQGGSMGSGWRDYVPSYGQGSLPSGGGGGGWGDLFGDLRRDIHTPFLETAKEHRITTYGGGGGGGGTSTSIAVAKSAGESAAETASEAVASVVSSTTTTISATMTEVSQKQVQQLSLQTQEQIRATKRMEEVLKKIYIAIQQGATRQDMLEAFQEGAQTLEFE